MKIKFDNLQKHLLCKLQSDSLQTCCHSGREKLEKMKERNQTLLPVRQRDVMIIDGESHVFLKVFQALRYEMFYPEWQL